MRILSFDLSSVCIGVIACEIDDSGKIIKISSCPIIPNKFTPTELGYLNSKKKITTKSGKIIYSYIKENEISISETEKRKRDREVRSNKDLFVLRQIGNQISDIVCAVKPDKILVEKNAIFNGILTTVLLAKIMGILIGIAGANGIQVFEYTVQEVRSIFNITNITKMLTLSLNKEEIKKIPDITKRALRFEMEKIYNIKFLTDDESDACVVFHYWYTKKR